ncbi:MAG: GNAT family N-acetyltransferase [Clostridiales bacterium]|nr:GNAT family N-acetyltransferase [Clostridiales bacterium]
MTIARWLGDGEVTQYLHEGPATAAAVTAAVERAHLPIVTHLFSRDGRFFMICLPKGPAVGFLRLAHRPSEVEVTLAIGERRLWGRGMGRDAIGLALGHAFFEWRARRVVANIHPRNVRSLRAFAAAGFQVEREAAGNVRMGIEMAQFLKRA